MVPPIEEWSRSDREERETGPLERITTKVTAGAVGLLVTGLVGLNLPVERDPDVRYEMPARVELHRADAPVTEREEVPTNESRSPAAPGTAAWAANFATLVTSRGWDVESFDPEFVAAIERRLSARTTKKPDASSTEAIVLEANFRARGIPVVIGFATVGAFSELNLTVKRIARERGYLVESSDGDGFEAQTARLATYWNELLNVFGEEGFMYAAACFGKPFSEAAVMRDRLDRFDPGGGERKRFWEMKKRGIVSDEDADRVTRFFAAGIEWMRTREAYHASGEVRGESFYLDWSNEERKAFVEREIRKVIRTFGGRGDAIPSFVVDSVKFYVEGYAKRIGNGQTGLWREDSRLVFRRAKMLAPLIIRSFNQEGVPPLIGLYLPAIESEYHDCLESPAGAVGLFQFMPETGRVYGLSRADLCDPTAVAPAAARYMKDRISEFGADAAGTLLGLAAYNRSPDSVRRDLVTVLDTPDRERSVWTLVAESERLDRWFANETVKYVPKFLAAAVVGENPRLFRLDLAGPLSSLSKPDSVGRDEVRSAVERLCGTRSATDVPEEFKNLVHQKASVMAGDQTWERLFLAMRRRGAEALAAAPRFRLSSEFVLAASVVTAHRERRNASSDLAIDVLGRLSRLERVFGAESVDACLIVAAAFAENGAGDGTEIRHPLLARMRRVVRNPFTDRTPWFLARNGAISAGDIDFVAELVAVGVMIERHGNP